MGVWIETEVQGVHPIESNITPFVGVWIETSGYESLSDDVKITPFVGVWIETRRCGPREAAG